MPEPKISRREFLRALGFGTFVLAVGGGLSGFLPKNLIDKKDNSSHDATAMSTTFPTSYLKTSIWVHGNVVRAEGRDAATSYRNLELARSNGILQVQSVNWEDIIGHPHRWGTTFYGKAKTSNWFNFPISNTIINDGRTIALQKVHLLYNSTLGAFINAIDIFDGSVKIKSIVCNSLYGNNNGRNRNTLLDLKEGITSWTILPVAQIAWGLMMSVQVVFHQESSITFVSAGADFIRQ